MQTSLAVQQIDGMDALLLREGWSLHQRLEVAIATGSPQHISTQLGSWRKIVAPYKQANFDKRLAWDGLDVGCAGWVLDPPAGAAPQAPDWWPLLQALRQAARDAAAGSAHQQLAERGSNQPFVHVWRPVAAWALETLQQRCGDLEPSLQLNESAWFDLAEALLERLCNTADQALWEQFNLRRTPGQMLLAHFGSKGDGSGEPVHEAYDAFVAELLSSGYGLVLAEYPVLGRLLSVITNLWLQSSEEMIRRVADSRAVLTEHFGIAPKATLQSIQHGLSDPHRGGRAVAILRFGEGDETRKVVYKPKDMQVDATYQRYLQVLNDASTLPPLRWLTVVNRDGYGFMEWVEHRICDNDDELARFYTNAGRTMAVLHLLGCTDCHHENLIASGDQLVLIDTETLLEADLRDLNSDGDDEHDLLSPLQNSMQGSVLRSGLLPRWVMLGAGRKHAVDISALGIQPPPPEREMPGWLKANSDGMMRGRSISPCELPTSLPVGLGSPQRLTDYVEDLCRGFADQLQEALGLRPLLLAALNGFSGQPRRLIARDTRLYFAIQRQMLEPAALRNAVSHALKLEQLSRSFVLASEKPLHWPLFKAELLQMERLDIPFFEHPIDGEELPLPEGLAPIPKFMRSSGLTCARRRLNNLDAAEITFQQQLIRGAIAARHLKTTATAPSHVAPATKEASGEAGVPGADVYRHEAFCLGEELWNSAIRDRKGRPEWLGMDLTSDGESFRFGLIGNSLYSGCSGIALLFGQLALASEGSAAQSWRQRAWACFEGLAELAERNSNDRLFRLVRDLPFGISGTGGTLLTLQLLQRVGLTQAAPLVELLVQQLRPERLQADEGIDLIGGISGLLGPLMLVGDHRAQKLATVCGDRLLELQQENGGWSIGLVSSMRRPPLTGFSHGAAGMAAALARLAQVTGVERFADAARRAVAYERSVFNAERGNWPDFRSSNDPNEFKLGWCHGAPGILLSRLVLQASGLGDAAMEAERQVARQSTMTVLDDMTANNNDYAGHLCCGALGLTSLLRVDTQFSGVPLSPRVTAAESKVISNAIANGGYTFFSVDAGSLNLPGMYTGKAGVALALLEAANGQQSMPAVLSAGLLLP